MAAAGKKCPHDECTHGAKGVLRYVGEIVGTGDRLAAARFIDGSINGKVGGRRDCPWGSGRCARECHADARAKLRTSGSANSQTPELKCDQVVCSTHAATL